MSTASGRRRRQPQRRPWSPGALIHGVGELFVTAGVVVLLFCAYELWGTNLYTSRQQDAIQDKLHSQWETGAPSNSSTVKVADVPFGEGFAVVWIPRLGHDYHYAIVQGADTAALKKGPGHYPGTAMPGQIGNFVVSGHRTTYLAPFNRIDELHRGDAIVIETRDAWYTYRAFSKKVVQPSDVDVIRPVPFHPGKQPTQRLITLTTCNPKYSARTRLIVFGRLADARKKAAGPPAVLAKGGA